MLTPELLEAFERIAANWYANPAVGLSPWIVTDDKSAQDTATLLFAVLEPTSKPFPKHPYVAYTNLFALSQVHPWNQLLLLRSDDQTVERNPTVSPDDVDDLFSIQRKYFTAMA